MLYLHTVKKLIVDEREVQILATEWIIAYRTNYRCIFNYSRGRNLL
jgi:hypothetical protein